VLEDSTSRHYDDSGKGSDKPTKNKTNQQLFTFISIYIHA